MTTPCPAPTRPTPPPRPRTRRAAAWTAPVAAALAGLAAACGDPTGAPTPTPPPIQITGPDGRPIAVPPAALTAAAAAPTDDPYDAGTFAERGEFPLPNSTRPAGYEGHSWQRLLDEAADSTVTLALREGDPPLGWIDEWVVDVAAGRYGIDVVTRTFATSDELVASLWDAAAKGRDDRTPSGIDLFWLDGVGYEALRDAGALYGPWTSYLPSRRYLDPADAALRRSFGVDVASDAMPWGRSQLVLLHDAERLPAPPTSWADLWDWIAAHPGRFAVAAPPDPVGHAFARNACLVAVADRRAFDPPWTTARAAEVLAPCRDRLAAAAPRLHRDGGRLPATAADAERLLAEGAVDLVVRDGPPTTRPGDAPVLPATTRAIVLDEGTLGRAHFLAIPADADDKPGAMVLANFLQSPEAQYAKRVRENWGDRTVVTLDLIPEHWRAGFAEADAVPPAVAPAVLADHRLDEPSAAWAAAIGAVWRDVVGAAAAGGGAP